MSSLCYLPTSEQDWKEKLDLLKKHGFTRSWEWRYKDYPVIGVEDDTKELFGHYSHQTSYHCGTWKDILKFLKIPVKKEFPKKWFVKVTKNTLALLKQLSSKIPNINVAEEIGYNLEWTNPYTYMPTSNWYARNGYTEISLEDTIQFILEQKKTKKSVVEVKEEGFTKIKKRVTAEFLHNGDKVIISGVSYTKDK